MSNIPAAKKQQLAGIAAGTILFSVVFWYFVIQSQKRTIEQQDKKVGEIRTQIETAKKNSRMLDRLEADFKVSKANLKKLEVLMPSGDVYRWLVQAFEGMQKTNWVTIFNIDPPRVEEVEIPPALPYKAALITVTGLAYYHDFGVFLANMENSMPFIRLQSLELKRAALADTGAADREQLSFAMELLTLVKVDPDE